MQRRLSLRLYVAFLGVLLAVTVVTSAINFFTAGRSIFGLLRGGPRMAAHLSRMFPPDADPQRILDEVHDELGVDVALVDRDGRVLSQAGDMPVVEPRWVDRAARGPGWLVPGRVVGAPVRGRPGTLVVVRMPVPTATILRPFIWLFAVLLVSFALVYPLSRSITRPIEKLTSAVRAYGKGDLSRRSGLAELQDEVGQLARSFDEMADRIQTTRRAEKELLANVSHELRTPLARIKVALELIETADERTIRRMASISEEVDELDRLVGDVLTAARLDLDALPLRKVSLPVHELAEKAKARAQALEPSMQIDVRAPDPLTLTADEALLSRALDNLLDNARKYGGQPVEISAEKNGTSAILRVRDRGRGFAPGDLDRVFEPFFRGNATRGSADGFGLGLALVRRVAQAHGGEAKAFNAPDGGACIELRLPLATQPPAQS